jgi:hypothetical protein
VLGKFTDHTAEYFTFSLDQFWSISLVTDDVQSTFRQMFGLHVFSYYCNKFNWILLWFSHLHPFLYDIKLCNKTCFRRLLPYHLEACLRSLYLSNMTKANIRNIFCRFNVVMSMISRSLSPRHGASSGCGWRNGLRIWRVAANMQSRTADKG